MQTVERMLAPLSFIPTLIFTTDVPYAKFLNRLHDVELNLASQGLWDVPHPWLNLFVPRSAIASFDALIFKHMIKGDFSGPILIYPLRRERYQLTLSNFTRVSQIPYSEGSFGQSCRIISFSRCHVGFRQVSAVVNMPRGCSKF